MVMSEQIAQTFSPGAWKMGLLSGDTALAGALIKPSIVGYDTECQGLFQASGPVKTGRAHSELEPSGLEWKTVADQVQFSMGVQGPQGSIILGGEASRRSTNTSLATEYSLNQSITFLEQARRSWVLVYQTSNGRVVEQSLYSLTTCLLEAKNSG
jgi:hypothetical protein